MKLPRFYPILDSGLLARRGIAVVDAADAILASGAEILQFRHKSLVTRETLADLEAVAALCCKYAAPLVVNDRADLAKMVGAALHLGQEDIPPSEARRMMGPDTPLGFSTHNEAQLRAAREEPVDYLALGPIFVTSSKENPDPVVGIEGLRNLRRLTARPLVAIGGITRANVDEVFAAGADSVAIIGDLIPEDGPLGSHIFIELRVREWISLLR
jgi:thiamine-phosphate pyrophosphorylase